MESNAATARLGEEHQLIFQDSNPRGTKMRPNSQKSQHSISQIPKTPRFGSRRILAARLFTLVAILYYTPTALAGTEIIEEQGRQVQTGPKGEQVAVDGIPLLEEQTSPTPSGRTVTEKGRHLTAKPTQPISVGFLGCPGCTWTLEAIGGVFIDVDSRRWNSGEHGSEGRSIGVQSAGDGKHGKRLNVRTDPERLFQTGPGAAAQKSK